MTELVLIAHIKSYSIWFIIANVDKLAILSNNIEMTRSICH